MPRHVIAYMIIWFTHLIMTWVKPVYAIVQARCNMRHRVCMLQIQMAVISINYTIMLIELIIILNYRYAHLAVYIYIYIQFSTLWFKYY